MLQFENQEAKLVDVTTEVIDKKGEGDNKLALDLDFEVEGSNDLLLLVHKKLKSSFFRKQTKAEQEYEPQEELIEKDPGYMPVLLFPEIKTMIPWNYTSDGFELFIKNGVDPEQSYEEFTDCRLSGIKFQCKDGGAVKIKFRVRVFPNMAQIGRTSSILKTSPPITLVAPSAGD